jgi:hypothetical protein
MCTEGLGEVRQARDGVKTFDEGFRSAVVQDVVACCFCELERVIERPDDGILIDAQRVEHPVDDIDLRLDRLNTSIWRARLRSTANLTRIVSHSPQSPEVVIEIRLVVDDPR